MLDTLKKFADEMEAELSGLRRTGNVLLWVPGEVYDRLNFEFHRTFPDQKDWGPDGVLVINGYLYISRQVPVGPHPQ